MKKLLSLLLFYFCLSTLSAQEFVFKKVLFQSLNSENQIVKIKGTVSVTDSVITISYDEKYNTPVSEMPVDLISDFNGIKQYMSGDNTRLTFSNNPSQKNGYTLLHETKDSFNGNLSSIYYFLTAKKEK